MRNKKRLPALLIAILLLFVNSNVGVLAADAVESAELIPNGSFEQLDGNGFPADWQVFAADNGTGTVSVVENAGRSGKVVKIETPNQYAIAGHDLTGKIAVEPFTKYKLTYWVRITDDDANDAMQRTFIRQHNASMGNAAENPYYYLSGYAVTGSCDWKRVEASFTTASDCQYIYIWLCLYNGGTLYLDDVSLQAVPAASDKMVDNGGFESVVGTMPIGFGGLSIDGGSGSVYSVDGGYSGNKAVCIEPTSGGYALFNQDDCPIVVKGSTDYRISYMVKIPGEGASLKPFVRQLTAAGGNTSENTYYARYEYEMTGTLGWTQVNVDFTTAPDARKIHIWLIAEQGEVYIDDLTMFEYAPQAGTVENGDFEMVNKNVPIGFGGLTIDGGSGSVYSVSGGYSGGKAVCIQPTAGDYALTNSDGNPILVNSATYYRISYMVKIPGEGAYLKPFIRQLTAAGGDTSENTYYAKYEYKQVGACGWTQVNVDFKTAPNAKKIHIWLIAGKGEVYIDRLTIAEYTPPKEEGIRNGDFSLATDDSFVSWSFWNGNGGDLANVFTLSVDRKGYSGNSAKITKTAGDSYAVLQQEANVPVKAGATYEFSYWVKTANAPSMRQYAVVHQCRADGSDTAANAWLTPQTVFGNTGWKQVAFRFEAEADAAQVNFLMAFSGKDSGAAVWYDNVALTEKEPSTEEEILGFDVEVAGLPSGWNLSWDILTPADMEYGMTAGVKGKAISAKKLTDADGFGVLISKALPVEPNTSYQLSYWIKANHASAYSYVFMHQYAQNADAENAWLWPSPTFWQYGKSDWKKVTVPFTTSSNATSLDIRLCSGGDRGTVICYDSVSLTKLTGDANLDFESVNDDGSPVNWFYACSEDAKATMSVDNTMSYTGSNSLHITRNNATRTFSVFSSASIAVNDARYYEFSYYEKSRGTVSNACAKLDLVVYDATGVALTTLSTVNANLSAADDAGSEWKHYSMTLVIPSGGRTGQFSLSLSPGTAEVWIDHITLKEVGSTRDETAFWDDFARGDRNGNVAGWQVSGAGATLTNEDGKAKLQAQHAPAIMSAELLTMRKGYVYEVTGNYAARDVSSAILRIKYFDTRYREMTALTNEEEIKLEESGAFTAYFTAPSCTTAEISLETAEGTLLLDDLTIKVSDRPASSSDWLGKWVWFNENAAISAVRVSRYFRQSFEIDQAITSAIIQITCDDKFALYINGAKVDEEVSDTEDTWKSVHVLDIAQYLQSGKNTVAVEAYNVVSSAGLLFDARIDLGNGVRQVVASGYETLVSPTFYEGWNKTEYDDSRWDSAMVIGAVPVLPWAEVAFDNTYFVDAAFELIEATTEEEETECGDYVTINLEMILAKQLTSVPEFRVKLWKRNTNVEVTSSVLEIIDGSDPKSWPVGEPFSVQFRMAVPGFINAGKYTLQLDLNKFKITNDLIYDNKFMDITAVRTVEKEPLKTEVVEYHGAPTLMINGVPEAFMTFLLPIGEDKLVGTAPSDMSSKGGMNLYLSFDLRLQNSKLWKKDGSVNFDEFDRSVIRAMSCNPGGYYMISVNIDTPDWWEELHPEEMCIDNSGNVTGVSTTSKLFREEAGEVIRQLLEHAKEQSYWNDIFGIRLTGTKTAEWLQYGAGLNGSIDYSPSAQNGFREWLAEKYGTDAALQAAWNNGNVTLETAEVPAYEERTHSEYGSILDPETQKNIIDFQDYLGSCVSDLFLYMCRIAKEVTDHQLIVGGYHGYIWNVYSQEGNDIIHSSMQKVLDSEYVDFISAPQCYNERDLGMPGTWMTAVDSVHASGKLVVQEQDNRTMVAPGSEWPEADSGVGKTYTTEDTINQLKRDYSQIITKGAGMWFYDMDGGWFHDDQIYELSSIMNGEADVAVFTEKASTSEVAVFVDEKTYEYSRYDFGATYQIYHYLYLEQRFNLGTMGAPYDIYRISDLVGDQVPDYKVNIILSPYQVFEEQREAIDRNLKKDGKILIWVFAPGISDGNTNDVAHISELTGITLGMKKETCRLNVTLADVPNAWLEGLSGVSYGASTEETGPYIYVNDADAQALGYLYDTDESRRQVGLAVKEMEDYTSVYSAAPNLPNLLLQNILKEAGIHLYSQNRDDIIYANKQYVAIHSAFAGEHTLTLPENHSVYDVYAGEFVSMDTDEIVVNLRDGESKLYRLLSPDTYAVTVTRNSGGTVSAFGLTEVAPGSSLDIEIDAEEGYHVDSVTVNGEAVEISKGRINLSEIGGNMAVKVSFAKGTAEENEVGAGFPWLLVAVLAGSVLVISGAVLFIVYQYRKKRRDEKVEKGGKTL